MPDTKRTIVILKFSFLICFAFFYIVYSQSEESTYFPLQIGDQWVYTSQNDTMIETIVDTIRIENNLYYSFDKFRDITGYLLRVSDDNVYAYADTAEYLWYDFNADSGDNWMLPPLGAPYMGGIFTMQNKTGTIVTPSETFNDCYRIHHHIGDDAEFDEWFAPGVGIVQRDVITITGSRRWILVDRVVTSVETSKGSINPELYTLSQNYPNPFNPTTKIKFTIPPQQNPLLRGDYRGGLVTLKVYDVLGNEIATLVNEEKPAGSYEVEFDATSVAGGLPSGIYFYKLQSGQGFNETRKMLLIK